MKVKFKKSLYEPTQLKKLGIHNVKRLSNSRGNERKLTEIISVGDGKVDIFFR